MKNRFDILYELFDLKTRVTFDTAAAHYEGYIDNVTLTSVEFVSGGPMSDWTPLIIPIESINLDTLYYFDELDHRHKHALWSDAENKWIIVSESRQRGSKPLRMRSDEFASTETRFVKLGCDSLEHEVLIKCDEDSVGLGSILWSARHWHPTLDAEALKKRTIQVCELLLERELIVAGAFNPQGQFQPWKLTFKDCIARIVAEWDLLGRDPDIGDIAWFERR